MLKLSPPVPQDVRQVPSSLDDQFELILFSLLGVVNGMFHRQTFTPFHAGQFFNEGQFTWKVVTTHARIITAERNLQFVT